MKSLLKALFARAEYEAAEKVRKNHPSSPYESKAERERAALAARAREITMQEARESSDIEWSNDYPPYVKLD